MDAITTAAGNAALLRIYDGAQPTDADTAIGAQTLLAELTCGTPFAAAASNGVLTAGAITQDSSANASGTAAWFRLVVAGGGTTIMDGTVGTADADLILNNVTISAGGPVAVSSFVLTSANV
jgi:hypothetical protein